MIDGYSQGILSGNSIAGGRVSRSQTDFNSAWRSFSFHLAKLGPSLSSEEAHNSILVRERGLILS